MITYFFYSELVSFISLKWWIQVPDQNKPQSTCWWMVPGWSSIVQLDILQEIGGENFRDKWLNFMFLRYFTLVIGVNEFLLVILIAFLPESKLWLAANGSSAEKSLLQRLLNIRVRPHQGLRRVSTTINNFFSRSNSSSDQSLPGIELESWLIGKRLFK